MPDFRAGLTDDDDLGQFPSAASPLTAAGIDPDEARANPALLRAAFPGLQWGDQFQSSFPGSDTSRLGPSASAASAGKAGGAGDGFQPPYYSAGQPEAPSQAKPRSAYDAPEVPGMPTPAGWMPAQAAPPPKAPKPLPAPVPAWTPAGAATPSLEDYERTGLDSLSKNADLATQAVQNVPTSSPEVDRLAAERAKLVPPALYNPQTGKMNPAVSEYDSATGQNVTVNPKPGVGSRIWRGVRGGLVGLLEGGIPGAALGVIEPGAIPGGEAYGAPNKAYTRAEERRGQQVESTDKSMATAFQNWKDQVDAARAKATEFRANATTGRDLTTGATGAINAATEAQKEKDEATNQEANTPQAKTAAALELNQKEFEQRQRRVAQMQGVSTLNKTLYMLNGNIPDPREPNEAEINASQAAKALVVFRAQHGGKDPQTLEDFNNIQAAARGQLVKVEQAADKIYDSNLQALLKSQNLRVSDLRKHQDNYKKLGLDKDAANLQPDIDAAQAEYDATQGKIKGPTNPTPSQPPEQTAPKGDAASLPPSDVVRIIDSSGNTYTLPKSNLDAAQKRDPKLTVLGK